MKTTSKLETILAEVSKTRTMDTDYWLTTKTANELSREVKTVRVSESGIIEWYFEGGIAIGIRNKSEVYSEDIGLCHIEIMYVNPDYYEKNYSNGKKACIIL